MIARILLLAFATVLLLLTAPVDVASAGCGDVTYAARPQAHRIDDPTPHPPPADNPLAPQPVDPDCGRAARLGSWATALATAIAAAATLIARFIRGETSAVRPGRLGKLIRSFWTDRLGLSTTDRPQNRADFERYKDDLREQMAKPSVSDAALARLLDELYRPGAGIGSGSTAAAVRYERASGGSVGGRRHSQKAQDMIRALERWLNANPTVRPGDRAAAENVIRDMKNALGR